MCRICISQGDPLKTNAFSRSSTYYTTIFSSISSRKLLHECIFRVKIIEDSIKRVQYSRTIIYLTILVINAFSHFSVLRLIFFFFLTFLFTYKVIKNYSQYNAGSLARRTVHIGDWPQFYIQFFYCKRDNIRVSVH